MTGNHARGRTTSLAALSEQVFARSPVPMAMNDLDGRFLDMNPSACALLELSKAEVVGRTSVELGLLPSTSAPAQQAFAAEVRQRGAARGEERTLHLRSGKCRRIALMVDVLEHDGDRCFLSTFVDVTEHRKAEQAESQSEARLEEVEALAHVGSWDWDLRTDIVTRSPELCRIFGMSPEEFETSPSSSYDRVHPDDRESLRSTIERALRERGSWEIEYRIVRPDGVRYLHTRGIMVVDDQGNVVRSFGTAQDVTEMRLADARLTQAERLSALGALAAGAAHEINNPLTGVMANLEMLAQELAPPRVLALGEAHAREVQSMLNDARTGAARVKTIVSDLAAFSHAAHQSRTPVDLQRVLDLAIITATERIRVRARLTQDRQPLPAVDGDEGALYQVFLNLLINAAEAIPTGASDRHCIHIATHRDGQGRAVVEISDTGCGIAPEHLGRIFEPFFTTKAVGAGTGLGLAVCHGTVGALGGHLAVDTVPGRGSTFRVVLPAAEAAGHDHPRAQREPGSEQRAGATVTTPAIRAF